MFFFLYCITYSTSPNIFNYLKVFSKLGTHWLQEMLSLIHVNGKVEDIDRNQMSSPFEFGDLRYHLYDEKVPTYIRARTWKSPRVLVTHVLEELLPKQLKEGKGKVRILTIAFLETVASTFSDNRFARVCSQHVITSWCESYVCV